MRDLVAAYQGRIPAGELADTLSYLDAFAELHWDFRRGRERHEVTEPPFTPPTRQLVAAVARALGLVEPVAPRHRRYTHLLVLGGRALSCFQRAWHARHLVSTGTVDAGEIGALASFRRLGPEEVHLAAALGTAGCVYEVDVLAAGTRAMFSLGEPEEDVSHVYPEPDVRFSWSRRTYRSDAGPLVRIIAAPAGAPTARRATTVDTYHYWTGQAGLTPGDRVLLVTSAIYVPHQHCDAVRILGLPYGCGIDTVGVNPALITDPLLRQAFGTGHYLQEIRSAIRSMWHLCQTLLRAQPEPVFGGGEHAPSSSVRAQPEPVFGGGEHALSSPGQLPAGPPAVVHAGEVPEPTP